MLIAESSRNKKQKQKTEEKHKSERNCASFDR